MAPCGPPFGAEFSVALEILHVALMLLGGGARFERSEIAALAGARIDLAGVEAEPAGTELADHCRCPSALIATERESWYSASPRRGQTRQHRAGGRGALVRIRET